MHVCLWVWVWVWVCLGGGGGARVGVGVCVSMQVSKRLSMSNITTQSFKGNLALIEEKLMVSCMKSIDKVLLGKCDQSSTFFPLSQQSNKDWQIESH